ncbi:MAG: 3-deoxy-8-phosphooctulonate synthase [Candidatus Gastranaerophilales bacterium]|nr:3-deoxy-8-phosphooctulonate synthase [Candidatus Gastranaerophilales bacterium]
MVNEVKLNNFSIGNDKLVIMAGPCVIEDDENVVFKTAEELKIITTKLDLPFIFKASYDKANRTSISSYRGVGIEKGLKILEKIKNEFEIPIVTDIHDASEAEAAAQVADVIQIPAFLCRQTDLLVAAAKTGKIINIKKGQFLAPNQIGNSANKVKQSGNNKILITERGVTFGYGNLVTDLRSIPIIHDLGYPVIMDATHSVQLPGGAGTSTAGERKYASILAKGAVAAGCDGVFFEVHPDPDNAPCDGPNMIALKNAYEMFSVLNEIYNVVN